MSTKLRNDSYVWLSFVNLNQYRLPIQTPQRNSVLSSCLKCAINNYNCDNTFQNMTWQVLPPSSSQKHARNCNSPRHPGESSVNFGVCGWSRLHPHGQSFIKMVCENLPSHVTHEYAVPWRGMIGFTRKLSGNYICQVTYYFESNY
jgi:hypothetical protein